MEGEAVIIQTERDTDAETENFSSYCVNGHNGLAFVALELELTCLWLLLLCASVADAATFSRIGYATPTRPVQQAATVFF